MSLSGVRTTTLLAFILAFSGCGSASDGASIEDGNTRRALGVNVESIQWRRPFMNLIYGSSWMIRSESGVYSEASQVRWTATVGLNLSRRCSGYSAAFCAA